MLVAQQIGGKSRTTVASASGGTELQETPRDLSERAVLSADQVLDLARIVRDVASALDYTTPLYDIEWVYDGTDFWIVQARPITARARYTYPALLSQPAFWSRANSRDVVPEPLTCDGLERVPCSADSPADLHFCSRGLSDPARRAAYGPTARPTLLRNLDQPVGSVRCVRRVAEGIQRVPGWTSARDLACRPRRGAST